MLRIVIVSVIYLIFYFLILKLSNKNISITSIPELLNGLSIVHTNINVRSSLVRAQLD